MTTPRYRCSHQGNNFARAFTAVHALPQPWPQATTAVFCHCSFAFSIIPDNQNQACSLNLFYLI